MNRPRNVATELRKSVGRKLVRLQRYVSTGETPIGGHVDGAVCCEPFSVNRKSG
jgi:hypothetical protein